MSNLEIDLINDRDGVARFEQRGIALVEGLKLFSQLARQYFPLLQLTEGEVEKWFFRGELHDSPVPYESAEGAVFRALGIGDVEGLAREISFITEAREANSEEPVSETDWSMVCKHQIPSRPFPIGMRWLTLQIAGNSGDIHRVVLTDTLYDPLDALHVSDPPEGDWLSMIRNDGDLYDVTLNHYANPPMAVHPR